MSDEMSGGRGAVFWRGLEELADTPAFREFLHREFPRGAAELAASPSRREFLKLMAASFALAGLSACVRQPTEKIVPYVKQPEEVVPGKPRYFATALPLGGYASGAIVTSHEGRPTKVEGNPQHPASLGATDAFMQAAILGLYDPDRAQAVTNEGQIRTWDAFLGTLTRELAAQRAGGGAGLRLLTGTVTSPTLVDQLRALLARFPAARWHHFEPVNRDNARAGALLAFGEAVDTLYRFDKAQVILALDANFLQNPPGRLTYARQFADGRRVRVGRRAMNRLYAIEPTPTITGALADHRLPVRAGQVAGIARAVARGLGVDAGPAPLPELPATQAAWVAALVRDLQGQRGASLVVAGDEQPPMVHALAHAINAALGNVGRTVSYIAPVAATPDGGPAGQVESLRTLVADMRAGQVDALVVLGGNPVYDAPADLGFADAFRAVRLRIGLGLYDDETAALCSWHIPEAHPLETWGDARAYDGTATILQPLIAPLYGGKSAHELLAAFLGAPTSTAHDIVRAYWQAHAGDGDFETFWRTTLNDGLVAGSAAPAKQVALRPDFAAQAQPSPTAVAGLEIVFRPDPALWDGRFANNGWLQELPRPLTKLTWDNAALVSPATAARLGLATEEVVELRYRGGTLRAPVWVQPGQADDTIAIALGYGRTRSGRVGTGVGCNAYALRTADAPWFDAGLELRKIGEQHTLASTQVHFSMEGRDLVRTGTLATFRDNPDFLHTDENFPTLYPRYPYTGNAWGMAIDTNVCIGCNACAVACQAENNIPIVGKDEVHKSREMNWLKIDAYYEGDASNPQAVFQPRPCMHCENAPCELVCPVAATVHDAEGLNAMVYNRCVGTRYCSNNCPYKVRRFNFFQYSDDKTEVLKLGRNPEVTVRMRGVMEKCTYCTQRIQAAKLQSQKEDRPVRDGEILTACQQACPTGAIVFGNLNDPQSQVAGLKAELLNYGLLAELNTRPRTSYLARLRNPNPEIATE